MSKQVVEISNILSGWLEKNKISEAELGRQIGVPRATINRLVSGRTPDPRASTLKAIADYFNISIDQLIGEQPVSVEKTNSLRVANVPLLPLLDWNHLKDLLNNVKSAKQTAQIAADSSIEEGAFALKVRGESMWPHFQENTILIFGPSKEPKNKDFVVAYVQQNDEMVFRQLILEGRYQFLKPINPIFPTLQIGDGDKIIGVLLQARNSYD